MTHTIGTYAFNKMTKTMTFIMVVMVLDQATNMDNFKACVLGPKKPRHWRIHDGLIQAYFRNECWGAIRVECADARRFGARRGYHCVPLP